MNKKLLTVILSASLASSLVFDAGLTAYAKTDYPELESYKLSRQVTDKSSESASNEALGVSGKKEKAAKQDKIPAELIETGEKSTSDSGNLSNNCLKSKAAKPAPVPKELIKAYEKTITINPAVKGEEYCLVFSDPMLGEYRTEWDKGEDRTVIFPELIPGKEYKIYRRLAQTEKKLASDPSDKVVVTTMKMVQEKPDAGLFKSTNVTFKGGKDGKVTGLQKGMECSIDGGKTWIKAEGNEITSQPAEIMLVRYAETADKSASEAVQININEPVEVIDEDALADNTKTTVNSTVMSVQNQQSSSADTTERYSECTKTGDFSDLPVYAGLLLSAMGLCTVVVNKKNIKNI